MGYKEDNARVRKIVRAAASKAALKTDKRVATSAGSVLSQTIRSKEVLENMRKQSIKK